MALDVYVMPLWRFKVGDFTSPLEATLGIEPTVIPLAALPRPQRPWYLRLLAWLHIIHFVEPEPPENPAGARERAVREVDALKTELTQLTGQTVDWQDVGGKVYGSQFHGHDFIKAFAAWCDHRDAMPEFIDPPEGNYYKHAVWELPQAPRRRFPVLVEHSLHTGYLFPAPFQGVYKVEPFKIRNGWEFYHFAASTQAVLREIEDLLKLIASWPVREPAPGKFRTNEAAAQMLLGQLREVCQLSVKHGLPVIFYG